MSEWRDRIILIEKLLKAKFLQTNRMKTFCIIITIMRIRIIRIMIKIIETAIEIMSVLNKDFLVLK